VPAVSVIIITRDEARHIRAALDSVAWADERIVVDSGSTDDTVALAREAGARVEVREWPGYGAQRNHAASLARNDWILALDADERVTPALAVEIRQLLASEPGMPGFRIPRVTRYLNRWIRTTDWYPDWQLRLYDRRRAHWSLDLVHESVRADGTCGRLQGELEHFAYRDVAHHVATINQYTSLAARRLAAERRRSSPAGAAFHALAAFSRNYVLRRGFTDGAAGFVVSVANSYYVWLKLVKLWEITRGPGAEPARATPRRPGDAGPEGDGGPGNGTASAT
jgi:glycosyltransferase involved in cell wall biosynthesis